jgi:hypothetical protein
MKALHTTLIVLLIAGVITTAAAQTPAQVSAIEARMAQLELQNRSLKRALEKVAGRPLEEILIESAPATPAPVQTPETPLMSQVDKSALAGQIATLQVEIGEAEKALAAWDKKQKQSTDPFAEKKGVRMSKVDAEKARSAMVSTLAKLKSQEATLKAQLGAE